MLVLRYDKRKFKNIKIEEMDVAMTVVLFKLVMHLKGWAWDL